MKKRCQPRIPGVVREPSHTSLLPEINRELRHIAAKYGVSPSWVRATILADALKIWRQPRYYMEEVPKKRKRA
jgi:hypothetical protein